MRKLAKTLVLAAAVAALPLGANAEVTELRIPLGAGGFGFLPLHMMQKHKLIEKKVQGPGVPGCRVIVEKPFGRDLASARALNEIAARISAASNPATSSCRTTRPRAMAWWRRCSSSP